MKIILNGKETEVSEGLTLQKLLQDMKIEPQLVACELNLKIIRRKDYGAQALTEGDQVEILQMIGGG